jgi:hypothetical protein
MIVDCTSRARHITWQRPKITYIAGFRPQHGTLPGRARGCARNLIQIVDVARAAVLATGQNAEIAHARISRP